jgi:membrane protein YqaA with SNARE-associated domain
MTVVPIPIETALTPAMIAAPGRRWALALAALGGSVTCALAWYALGHTLGAEATAWLGAEDQVGELREEIGSGGFGLVVLAGVTPIPFQIACVAAGLAGMPLVAFSVASLLARGIRYLGLAALVTAVGDRARRWVLERSWALTLAVALVGGALFGIGALVQAIFRST